VYTNSDLAIDPDLFLYSLWNKKKPVKRKMHFLKKILSSPQVEQKKRKK
jgi:hypothetical protein